MRGHFLKEGRRVIITLNRLPAGQTAVVERVDTDMKIGRRLRELGIFRGAAVKLVGVAPLGDPVAVQALDTRIAMRRELAARIHVCTNAIPSGDLRAELPL